MSSKIRELQIKHRQARATVEKTAEQIAELLEAQKGMLCSQQQWSSQIGKDRFCWLQANHEGPHNFRMDLPVGAVPCELENFWPARGSCALEAGHKGKCELYSQPPQCAPAAPPFAPAPVEQPHASPFGPVPSMPVPPLHPNDPTYRYQRDALFQLIKDVRKDSLSVSGRLSDSVRTRLDEAVRNYGGE